MTDEWAPIPDPAGDREPPRRRPPTAVGVLTPPPPRRPKRSAYSESSLRRRLAQAFLGASSAFTGIAAAAIASHPATVLAGSIIALAGARLLGLSVRAGFPPRDTPNRDGRLPAQKRAA